MYLYLFLISNPFKMDFWVKGNLPSLILLDYCRCKHHISVSSSEKFKSGHKLKTNCPTKFKEHIVKVFLRTGFHRNTYFTTIALAHGHLSCPTGKQIESFVTDVPARCLAVACILPLQAKQRKASHMKTGQYGSN